MVKKEKNMFRVVITLDRPIVVLDCWPRKPSKNQVLEMLADEIREGKFDSSFRVVVEETKKEEQK